MNTPEKYFLFLLLVGCAQPKPVEAPISIEVPAAPTTVKEELPKYVPQWRVERSMPWDTEVQVIDQSELIYKRGGIKVQAIARRGQLLLTCDETMASINQCLANGGPIQYQCGPVGLVVSCKYIQLVNGNESLEILQEPSQEKEKENQDGVGN